MLGRLTITLLQIYGWVCFARIFEIPQHLASPCALCAAALFCWKMKNSIKLRLILFTNFDSVIDKYQTDIMSTTCDSATDTITDWTFVVCAGAFSRRLSSCVMDQSFCGVFFGVATVNVFFSVNRTMLTSLGEYFSATVFLNGWVLHGSLLQLWGVAIFVHKHFTRYCSDAFQAWLDIYRFARNLLLSLPVKEFWKSTSIWQWCILDIRLRLFLNLRGLFSRCMQDQHFDYKLLDWTIQKDSYGEQSDTVVRR